MSGKEKCPVCDQGFNDQRGARMHAWDVHGACHFCGSEFDEKDEMYRHWLEDHPDEIDDSARKRAENAVGDRTLCPVCEKRFNSHKGVRDHSWESHGACQYCGEKFDDKTELHTHWLASHPSELPQADRDRALEDVGQLSFRDRLTHQGPVSAVAETGVSRRSLIAASVVGLIGLAGYGTATWALGGDSESSSGNSLDGHPAATNLDSQPFLGPPPIESSGTIIAFEDPSCPTCARFELRTFPEMKSQLVDTGKVSFVYRGIPVVYPWGETAILALEATFDRNPEAFWTLKNKYYENQRSISRSNVNQMTRQFLSEISGVDANGVMEDVDQGTYQNAVDQDVSASQDAGVGGTPTFFLFKEGEFITKIIGAQNLTVFRNSLGL